MTHGRATQWLMKVYNRHRPHRGRNLRPPDGGDNITAPVSDLAAPPRIRHRTVLDGLIREYERAA